VRWPLPFGSDFVPDEPAVQPNHQAAVLLVITLVVTGYAFTLAFEVRGAPDQARIAQFAAHLGRSSWWVLQILLTVPAAIWAVRRIQLSHHLHGVLIGLVVAAIGSLMARTISVRTIATFALTVGAGWLGGAIAAAMRNPRR
jgi:hypothetical protein